MAAEVADPVPLALRAVTSTRTRKPTSAARTPYDFPVAPGTLPHTIDVDVAALPLVRERRRVARPRRRRWRSATPRPAGCQRSSGEPCCAGRGSTRRPRSARSGGWPTVGIDSRDADADRVADVRGTSRYVSSDGTEDVAAVRAARLTALPLERNVVGLFVQEPSARSVSDRRAASPDRWRLGVHGGAWGAAEPAPTSAPNARPTPRQALRSSRPPDGFVLHFAHFSPLSLVTERKYPRGRVQNA